MRPCVLVVCNGGKTSTEYLYFTGFRDAHNLNTLRVEPSNKVIAPVQLVACAELRARECADYDEVWAVCDVDDFDLTEAKRLASSSGVMLAISNPCFEVWLLLHYVEWTRALAKPAEATRRVKKHCPAWSKGRTQYSQFANGIQQAVARARKLEAAAAVEQPNPSTGVWRIVAPQLSGQRRGLGRSGQSGDS
jgi:hypothetical protein